MFSLYTEDGKFFKFRSLHEGVSAHYDRAVLGVYQNMKRIKRSNLCGKQTQTVEDEEWIIRLTKNILFYRLFKEPNFQIIISIIYWSGSDFNVHDT